MKNLLITVPTLIFFRNEMYNRTETPLHLTEGQDKTIEPNDGHECFFRWHEQLPQKGCTYGEEEIRKKDFYLLSLLFNCTHCKNGK